MSYEPKDLDMVFIFKLLNGDTIIAFLVEDKKNGAIVYKPLGVETLESVDEDNENLRRSGILMPWIMSTTSEIHYVNKSHIVAVAVPDEELLQIYLDTIEQNTNYFNNTDGFDNLSKFNDDEWWKRN